MQCDQNAGMQAITTLETALNVLAIKTGGLL
jgi:hypothetical protein